MYFFGSADVDNWVRQLRVFSKKAGKFIIPGHGDIYPHSRLSEAADFIEALKRAANHCLEQLPRDPDKRTDEIIYDIIGKYLSAGKDDAPEILGKASDYAGREIYMIMKNRSAAERLRPLN